MDWTAQTNEMMKSWGDAQKRLWSGWMDWAQGAANIGQPAASFDPTQFFRMGVDTWSGLKEGPLQRLAGNIFGTPEVMTRSMNLLMKAWQTVAPSIEQGKPWQPDLQKLIEQWREEMTKLPGRTSAMGNDFAQLTKAMFERWTPITAPWLNMISQMSAGHPGAAFLGGTAGPSRMAEFGEMFQGMLGEYSLGEMPRATVAREKMGKFLKVADTISDLQEAQRGYQKILSDGIAQSVERTIEHLAKLAEKGEKVDKVRDLMRTFFSIADRTLMEKFNTPEFLAVQDKLTDALMAHKKAQREALEIVYASMEIPTRSEIDEAYKDIHELKREVRALRRALKDATGKPVLRHTRRSKEAESEAAAS
jgi:class III poly(R)-hydroxyalkanoic acid synthase PhaE subunit